MLIYQRYLRSLLPSLLFACSLPTCALASSLTWQGPYIGGYLGGAFGNNHISTNTGGVTSTSYFTTSADINAVNNAGTWTQNPSALFVGLQAGHDWVFKQMVVYGVVFDYSSFSLNSSRTINNTYPNNADQYALDTSMRTTWLFTLRGRLGYPIILYVPSLFYLTGGMAMTQLKASNRFNDNSAFAGTGSSNNSENQIGWTAGAGIEILAYNRVSVDFEYLYVRAPSLKTTGSISNSEGGFGIPTQSKTSSLATTAKLYANVFKIGLNYRFDE